MRCRPSSSAIRVSWCGAKATPCGLAVAEVDMAVGCQKKFIKSAFSTSVDAGSYLGEAAAESRSGTCCFLSSKDP